MLAEVKFTEARNDFSNLYNKVYNELNPVIVRRKQTEQVILLPIDLQKLLLEEYKLTPKKLSEDDGSITLALDEMEIYANADTIENAVADLIQDIKYYALDYIKRLHLFLNAPNRRSHFPYILRVLLCDNDNEIRALLEV
jgi:antitoxin YefM